MAFKGIEGIEKEDGLQVFDEYILSWDIPIDRDLMEGSMDVFRNPGSKEVWVDVVSIQEGVKLEVYALSEGESLSDGTFLGMVYESGGIFDLNDFLEGELSNRDLVIALNNRGTSDVMMEEEASGLFYGIFNSSREDLSLNIYPTSIIYPGFCALLNLGKLDDLEGSAVIELQSGEEISFTWDPEVLESPENGSGGCAVSSLSNHSLLLLVPIILLGITWRKYR